MQVTSIYRPVQEGLARVEDQLKDVASELNRLLEMVEANYVKEK